MAIYTTPPDSILQPLQPTDNAKGVYTIDSIASVLSAWGIACNGISIDIAPQLINYHFDLINPLHRSKIKKYIPALSAVLRNAITLTDSNKHAHFALTMPRLDRYIVPLRAVICNKHYQDTRKKYDVCLGYDAKNEPVIIDISAMPHILIAGSTGSGKSVCINTILSCLLFATTPCDIRFLMIDTKQVELSAYDGIPHLLAPIAKDSKSALKLLKALEQFMRKRQQTLAEKGINDIKYTDLPRILLVIDELADLILLRRDYVEPLLVMIAQLGRATGIHVMVATQRPTVNVVTGLLKANLPCRIALQTASVRDSMTILDHKGAETLMGRGDSIIKTPDKVTENRLQIAFTAQEEVKAITDFWRYNAVK